MTEPRNPAKSRPARVNLLTSARDGQRRRLEMILEACRGTHFGTALV